MYDSPIRLLVADNYQQLMQRQEDAVYTAVLHFAPEVNKAELIRALQYDRDQYNKGYADGKADTEAARGGARQGVWVEIKGVAPAGYHGKHMCSRCFALAMERDGREELSAYCPHCGAIMDLET